MKNSKRLFVYLISFFVLFVIVVALAFFLFENKKRYNSEENFKISEIFNEFSEPNRMKGDVNNLLNSADAVEYNQELKDLILLTYYVSVRKNLEYIELSKKIVNTDSYSDISKSFARICFISFILEKGGHYIKDYEADLIDYLSFFQNPQQEYFSTSLLLKSIYYFVIKDFDQSKSYAERLVNETESIDFLKEQAKVILLRIENNLHT